MRRALATLTLGLALGAGCATAKGRMDDMRQAIEGYNNAFRWNAFPLASNWLPNDARASFLSTYEDAESKLHLEGFEVQSVVVTGEDSASVILRVSYLEQPSVVLKTKKITQYWKRLHGAWTLESEDGSIRYVEKLSVSGKGKAKDGASAAQDESLPEFAPIEEMPPP